eukprot:2229722-Prymnesium_polylepis.1
MVHCSRGCSHVEVDARAGGLARCALHQIHVHSFIPCIASHASGMAMTLLEAAETISVDTWRAA